jgi:hypothetical protein
MHRLDIYSVVAYSNHKCLMNNHVRFDLDTEAIKQMPKYPLCWSPSILILLNGHPNEIYLVRNLFTKNSHGYLMKPIP